ncbi:glycerophosphodiester phosphodiesterase family protein [Bifidobacterium cebidarum]|uniref:Glycerophosphodiester phosphodiesterase n=1 Tax=Bifidobacterium cebidarum TaxID=2650773 RepID=A0A6I1GCR7_9BIFI|nr:glycerophosphodiester phosphodiesterase family protein [Bifidobacterium cebidarum]KAB7789430.1 glycerophosphodiester phosphodiesterase [Bifidobacterium cebidarum]
MAGSECVAQLTSRANRRWMTRILILVLSLALVLGVGMLSAVRTRRKEQDEVGGWQVKPLSIAHRGDDSAPENSTHAIANAGANGADYAEVDVRLDADGVPVVFHDRMTGRLAAGGRNVPVDSLSTHELQHMHMRQNGENFHVPTLDEAIMAAQHANDHLGLLLDLKTGSAGAGRLTHAVSDVIERRDFAGRVMVMAVNDDAITAMRALHPDWQIGKCVSPAGHPEVGWPRDASFVVMRGDRMDEAIVSRANRDNVPIYAGVSANYREGSRCLKMGADGVLGSSARSVHELADRFALAVHDGEGGSEAGRPVWR